MDDSTQMWPMYLLKEIMIFYVVKELKIELIKILQGNNPLLLHVSDLSSFYNDLQVDKACQVLLFQLDSIGELDKETL